MTTKEKQNQEKKLNALLDNIKELVKNDINEDRAKQTIENLNITTFLYNVSRRTHEQVIANMTYILCVDYEQPITKIFELLND